MKSKSSFVSVIYSSVVLDNRRKEGNHNIFLQFSKILLNLYDWLRLPTDTRGRHTAVIGTWALVCRGRVEAQLPVLCCAVLCCALRPGGSVHSGRPACLPCTAGRAKQKEPALEVAFDCAPKSWKAATGTKHVRQVREEWPRRLSSTG